MDFIKSLFIKRRFFIVTGTLVVMFVLGNFFRIFTVAAKIGVLAMLFLLLLDILLLYRTRGGIEAKRESARRLSNGDNNELRIRVRNRYRFNADIEIIDEVPGQFQVRNFMIRTRLGAGRRGEYSYSLRPVERGEYFFGDINIFVSSPLGFVSRRFKISQSEMVPVYPSYIQMRKYELLAISRNLTEAGIKKIRRIGHTMEFDHIRDYVRGDDYRTINWKATARKSKVMVNQYQEEKSQAVYSILDMGRVMEMPFYGMTLLDYAINASLAISNIAILKQDRAGIITFAENVYTVIPAARKKNQIFKILESLYGQKTNFMEADYEKLYSVLRHRVHHRSLILLYTNFETLSSLKRHLKNFRKIADRHLLVVIFFENTELKIITGSPAGSLEEVYTRTIAEKFMFEKKQIIKELGLYGIHSILTAPEELSVNTINKYLELKSRGMI